MALLRRAAMLCLMLAIAGCSTTGTLEPPAPVDLPGPVTRYSELVIDASTGATLQQVNATAMRYPASLTKMMTLYLLFEAMDQGRVTRSTQIPVSANAARQPPSRLGLKAGADDRCRDRDRGAGRQVGQRYGGGGRRVSGRRQRGAVRPADDGPGAPTRHERRRPSGMRPGLPDEGQRTTARDMAVLGLALRSRFPQHFHYFSQRAVHLSTAARCAATTTCLAGSRASTA